MSDIPAAAAANAERGEAVLMIGGIPRLLRPSFSALVAAEEDLGSLFALVDRAAAGNLRITELTGLFWHCLADRERFTREEVGAAVVAAGLAGTAKPLRVLLGQILQGSE